jgi:hypothetical protein
MRMIVRVCTARAASRHSQFAVASGLSSGMSKVFLAALLSAALCTLPPARAQYVQQGPKLVGTGPVGGAEEGSAAALSADGNTAIVGGRFDNSNNGAVWFFTRSGGSWTQQGPKLVGSGAVGPASLGFQVAISADGNTSITSGYTDNMGAGAAWIFIRDSGAWVQQGPKLFGTGAASAGFQGTGVALSADGNTAIVGSQNDGTSGATWVFTRSNGVWSQQGLKLVGTGATGNAGQGTSVALSADGNTLLIGGSFDNSSMGAAWVFTRSGSTWTQQGSKLVGTGGTAVAQQAAAVALSADGNTAILGGPADNSIAGAVWVFTRSGSTWSQQGSKLVGTGAVPPSNLGAKVALSSDGNSLIVGGYSDNTNVGAAWIFTRTGSAWSQRGAKLVGSGAVGPAFQGLAVAMSGDRRTALVGGVGDVSNVGATWAFALVGAHDFNADSRSDVAWRNAEGDFAAWLMNGTQITPGPVYGPISNIWSIVGQRDFNGDGNADLVWRDTSGNVAIWEMNGTAVLNPSSSFVANVPTNWSIVGTGDFNGDAMGDLLWQDTSGNVAIWEMNGTAVLNVNSSFVANVPTNWSIVGTGDFNGDGKSDILWQDTSGNVAIWEMNGTTILNPSSSFVLNVPSQWSIKGTGDFNGDGFSDILWRDTSGNVAIWEMNGITILNSNSSFVANVANQWSIQLTGDYNGDGFSDILWRDTSGNVALWEMNGTAVLNVNSSFLGNVQGQWSIQRLSAE